MKHGGLFKMRLDDMLGRCYSIIGNRIDSEDDENREKECRCHSYNKQEMRQRAAADPGFESSSPRG